MNGVYALNYPLIATGGQGKLKPGIFFGAALLACAAPLGSSSLAMAQAGSLDSTFGTGGVFS